MHHSRTSASNKPGHTIRNRIRNVSICRKACFLSVLVATCCAPTLSFATPPTGLFFDWGLRYPAGSPPMNAADVPSDPPPSAVGFNYRNGFYDPNNTGYVQAFYYFTDQSRGYVPMGFLGDYLGNHQYFTGTRTDFAHLPPMNGTYDGMWTIGAREGWPNACMAVNAAGPIYGQADYNTTTKTEVFYTSNGTLKSTSTVTSVSTPAGSGTTTNTTPNPDGTNTVVTTIKTLTLSQGKKHSLGDMLGIDWTTGLYSTTVKGAQRMDYVLMDIEGPLTDTQQQEECAEVVRLVRASPLANVKNACVGNYGYAPGRVAPGSYPQACDNKVRSDFYLSSGMNVAQPACYPVTSYSVNTNSYYYGQNICPNVRAAIFWAPLERFSAASRNLPANHVLIPWVSVGNIYAGYGNVIPEKQDFLSLIKHYRMRGADGIANNGIYNGPNASDIPAGSWILDYMNHLSTYRHDILDAWNSLNAYFDPAGVKPTVLLNLGTDVVVTGNGTDAVTAAVQVPMANKVNGLEWSGVRYGNTVRVLVSNLSATTAQQVNLPTNYGLPASTALVNPNSHDTFSYTITNTLANPDFSMTNNVHYPWYPGVYSATGGVNGSPCLAPTGSTYAAYYTVPVRTEPCAKMTFKVAAKASIPGSRFSLSYYCFDKSGQIISGLIGTITTPAALTGAFQTYTFNFDVKNDSRVYGIEPILYNTDYTTGNPNILYVDDVALKFQD